MISSSDSLLERAKRLDPAAWERLCRLFGPVVYGWCRQRSLQDSDAADVVQDVFSSVYRNLEQFRREKGQGSFHRWLWTITANCIRLHFRRQGRQAATAIGSGIENLPDLAADETGDGDQTLRRQLVGRTLRLVEGDFSAQTWQAFVRTTLQSQSYQEVAAALGMRENAVRQARFRVLRRLREELDGLI